MRPNQNKADSKFVFFAADASNNYGTYPSSDDTTFSSPICSYHVVGSTGDLIALKKTHAKPVKLIGMGVYWRPVITNFMYMCRDSAANCNWAKSN